MSKADYVAYLKRRIQTLEARVEADRKRLAGGSPEQKVAAAGDRALVEERLSETKNKLSNLEAEPEGTWENFKAELEREVDYLEDAIERWFERRR